MIRIKDVDLEEGIIRLRVTKGSKERYAVLSESMRALLDKLANNSTLRTKMGEQGYKFLKENYTVKHSYEIIMKHFA